MLHFNSCSWFNIIILVYDRFQLLKCHNMQTLLDIYCTCSTTDSVLSLRCEVGDYTSLFHLSTSSCSQSSEEGYHEHYFRTAKIRKSTHIQTQGCRIEGKSRKQRKIRTPAPKIKFKWFISNLPL